MSQTIPPPRGVITWLFTDIEGSTRLWAEQPQEMATAVGRHDRLVRATVAQHRGYVFGVGGDGFFAAFETPGSALQAARGIQSLLETEPLLQVRIGLHTGEASFRDGGFFGLEVNRTARITTAAHGRQIVVSETTAALLADDVDMAELGRFALRGFEDSTTVWQIGHAEFPPLRAQAQSQGNLKAINQDLFIGRADELGKLDNELAAGCLLTLVGIGGVGKTRLATECGIARQNDFPDGVWLVPLAPVSNDADAQLLASAAAAAIGVVAPQGVSDTDVLLSWLSTSRALLILDNCEHVVEPIAELLSLAREQATNASIIATSQVPLAIPGELVIPVQPLIPSDGHNASVELFAARAAAARRNFVLDDANNEAIADICQQLDHLPLAIEFAAAAVRAMTPSEIRSRLGERFRFLTARVRHVEDRHRTLDAALRWSFELLDETDQIVLCSASVFAAPFTMEQAQRVAGTEAIEDWDVFDAILRLVDRSLIETITIGDQTRYLLLETVKNFGRRELTEAGTLAEAQSRFVDVVHSFALETAQDLLSARSAAAVQRLDAEWQQIQAVLRITADDAHSSRFEELYSALAPMWNQHGRASEGARWARDLADRTGIDPHKSVTAMMPAAAAINSASTDDLGEIVGQAERLWREHDTEPPALGFAFEGMRAMLAGENEAAIAAAVEALELCESIPLFSWNRNQAICTALAVLSIVEPELEHFRRVFDVERARHDPTGNVWYALDLKAIAARVIDRLEVEDPIGFVADVARKQLDAGFPGTAGHSLDALGILQLFHGNLREAAESILHALELTVENGPGYLWSRLLSVISVLLEPNPAAAARILGHQRRCRREVGEAVNAREVAADAYFEEALRESCGDRYDELVAEGDAMSSNDSTALALESLRVIATRQEIDAG